MYNHRFSKNSFFFNESCHRKTSLVMGTRGSALALKQAEQVKSLLLKHCPDLFVELSVIKTAGDRTSDPLTKIGGEGVFVKEIEEALLSGDIDIAVHSLKDMPTRLLSGLMIAAVLERTEYRDAFISNQYPSLVELPTSARVGTSSFRRKIQILKKNPHVHIFDLRGNIDTRLRKLDSGEYDAIVMSAVGLQRLGWASRIGEYLDFYPAVGQGAIAIEMREKDTHLHRMISKINHEKSFREVQIERWLLEKMGGGCQVPMGALVEIHENHIYMKAFIGSLDGSLFLEHNVHGFIEESEPLVSFLSKTLLENGGKKILEEMYDV